MNTKFGFTLLGILALGATVACGDNTTSTGGAGGTTSTGGTGSGGDKPTTTGSGGSGGTAAATLDCASYCTEVMANCTEDNGQYSAQQNCLDACKDIPLGTIDDKAGNTLGCRLYHGGAPAKSDPATHCIHAGPLGGDTCIDKTECEGFCQIAVKSCATQYPDYDQCITDCGTITDVANTTNKNPGVETTPYNTNVTTGDTLACRMYHLQVAEETPDPHCTHTPAKPAVGTPCAGN